MNTTPPRRASQPQHRPLGATFFKYVAREALRPTLFALLGLTAVILTKDLLSFSDLIINRGLSARTVGAMAFYQATPIAALMFPFSVLLGCLAAMGRLGADREILTLEANGVPAGRLAFPLVVFSLAMTLISLWFSVVASPWANRSLDTLLDRVKAEKPWSQIQKGESARFGGWRVEAREVSSGGDRLEGVLMWMPDLGETVFAGTGRMEGNPDGSVQIHLYNGSVLLSPRENARLIRFETMTTKLPSDAQMTGGQERPLRLSGLDLAQLNLAAANFVPEGRDAKPQAAIEFHRRLAMPAATLVFGFLAAPLLLIRRSFSRASGSVLGIALTLAYYALTQLGEGLIQGKRVTVATGVWMPNLILAALAIALLVQVIRTSALGHAFERAGWSLRRASRAAAISGYRPRRFPLPRYIAARFLQLALLTFAVMMVAYLLINVMERLDWFAKHAATGEEILRYYAARLPLLASRVVPMSLLVATALTVSVLAAEGELIGMRACGISAPRGLLPVLVAAALMVPIYFTLNDVVVPRTNALAEDVKENQIKDGRGSDKWESRKETVWYRASNQVLEAELFDPESGEASMLVVYELGEDGYPVSRIDADSARHVGDGEWRLSGARMLEVTADTVRKVPAPRYAALGAALPAEMSTSQLSVAGLGAEIAVMEADGYDATAYKVDRQVKLAQPLACLILPALVLFFAVGGPPFPSPAQNLLVSIVVGVGYLMVTGVSASFGYGGTISPALGGWGPNLLFLAIAAYFGSRLWRRL